MTRRSLRMRIGTNSWWLAIGEPRVSSSLTCNIHVQNNPCAISYDANLVLSKTVDVVNHPLISKLNEASALPAKQTVIG